MGHGPHEKLRCILLKRFIPLPAIVIRLMVWVVLDDDIVLHVLPPPIAEIHVEYDHLVVRLLHELLDLAAVAELLDSLGIVQILIRGLDAELGNGGDILPILGTLRHIAGRHLVEKGLVFGDHLGHGIVIYREADLPVTAREIRAKDTHGTYTQRGEHGRGSVKQSIRFDLHPCT